jgi:hypothetical protein
MKFLKKRALASLVLYWNSLEAVIWRRSRAKPGFFSSALILSSAD